MKTALMMSAISIGGNLFCSANGQKSHAQNADNPVIWKHGQREAEHLRTRWIYKDFPITFLLSGHSIFLQGSSAQGMIPVISYGIISESDP